MATLEQNIMPGKITFIISHTRRKSGFDRDFGTQKNFCAARACAPTRRCIGLPAMVPLGDQNVVRAATLEATATRNCKRRACPLIFDHWETGKVGSQVMTREPGDLPSLVQPIAGEVTR